MLRGPSGIVNARSGTVLVTVKTLMRLEQALVAIVDLCENNRARVSDL